MASMILDERDQQFVLYEMLGVEKVCEHPKYADFSIETFNMILTEARKIAEDEILPTLAAGRQGGVQARRWSSLRAEMLPPCIQTVLRRRMDWYVFLPR